MIKHTNPSTTPSKSPNTTNHRNSHNGNRLSSATSPYCPKNFFLPHNTFYVYTQRDQHQRVLARFSWFAMICHYNVAVHTWNRRITKKRRDSPSCWSNNTNPSTTPSKELKLWIHQPDDSGGKTSRSRGKNKRKSHQWIYSWTIIYSEKSNSQIVFILYRLFFILYMYVKKSIEPSKNPNGKGLRLNALPFLQANHKM